MNGLAKVMSNPMPVRVSTSWMTPAMILPMQGRQHTEHTKEQGQQDHSEPRFGLALERTLVLEHPWPTPAP